MKTRSYALNAFISSAAIALSLSAVADPSSAVSSTNAVPAAAPPTSQIWECTTNGVRTFSSNPCGSRSTVRELNPINVMQPAPNYHVTHTSAPPPAANYGYAAEDSGERTDADTAYNAYPGYVMVVRAHRARGNAGRYHHLPAPHHR